MITINEACNYLNLQMAQRPEFMVTVLRTMWSVDAGDIPVDIEVYATSVGNSVTNMIGFWNGLFAQKGYRINLVMVDDVPQFMPEKIEVQAVNNLSEGLTDEEM